VPAPVVGPVILFAVAAAAGALPEAKG